MNLTRAVVFTAIGLFVATGAAQGKHKTREAKHKTRRLAPNCQSLIRPITEGDTVISGVVPAGTEEIELRADNRVLVGAASIEPSGTFHFALDPGESLKTGTEVRVHTSKAPPSPAVTVEKKPTGPTFSRLSPLHKDDDVVSGQIERKGKLSKVTEVTLRISDAKKRFRAQTEAVLRAGGEFAAGFERLKLNCKDVVEVIAKTDSGGTKVDQYSVGCPNPEDPRFFVAHEGDTSVSGTIGDASKVTLEIWRGSDFIDSGTAKADDNGQFALALKEHRLGVGEQIRAIGLSEKGEPMTSAQTDVLPVDFDWGRVRAYFASGVLFSQNDGDDKNANFFSRSDFFMSFNIDTNWVQRRSWRVHTFFDSRLGAIPVAKDGKAFDNPNAFKETKKAASFQAGGYAPRITTRWHYKGEANALFLAPLIKAGVITPTGDRDQNLVNPNRFYNFWAFGGRLGHFKEFERSQPCSASRFPDRNRAPELLSFLDLTFGKWGNFQSPSGAFAGVRTTPWRLSVEGALKIPSTPFIVGFNANVAATGLPKKFDPETGKPLNFKPVRDDLRLLFGTRFDVGKVLAKMLNF